MDVVLVQVLLAIVPAHSVEALFDLKHHRAKRAHSRQVVLADNALVIRVEYEARLCSVLPVEAAKDEDA